MFIGERSIFLWPGAAVAAAATPTDLNQALAFALRALFASITAPQHPKRGPWALWADLALLAVATAWS